MIFDDYLLATLIFAAAILYSSVGHGGASAYLGVMALWGIAPEVMKPTALGLNILVAGIATARFYRSGAFSWKLLWPFAVGSVPCAFLGGALTAPDYLYKPLVGVVLLYAAGYLLWTARGSDVVAHGRPPAMGAAVASGAGLGLLSGLTGVGGGIFLSPLLLLMHWGETRVVCGVVAAFILMNSTAGLAGLLTHGAPLSPFTALWAVASVAGGLIGSELGSRRLKVSAIRVLLGAVLAIAGAKMLYTTFL